MIAATRQCKPGEFQCDNNHCIYQNQTCDQVNDCGDRSDEINCTSEAVNFSIRLAGGNNSHEGRLEVSGKEITNILIRCFLPFVLEVN